MIPTASPLSRILQKIPLSLMTATLWCGIAWGADIKLMPGQIDPSAFMGGGQVPNDKLKDAADEMLQSQMQQIQALEQSLKQLKASGLNLPTTSCDPDIVGKLKEVAEKNALQTKLEQAKKVDASSNKIGLAILTTPQPAQAGHLIKATTSPAVYLVDRNGRRRSLASAQIFEACGLDWAQVETRMPEMVAQIVEGGVLTSVQMCRELRPSQSAPALAGRLLKIASEAEVYLIGRDGYRYLVGNPTVFTGCGLDWGRIETVPPGQVFAISAGSPPGFNSAIECQAKR